METNKDIFELEMFGQKNEVKIEYACYNCNGTLALQLFSKADDDELDFYKSIGNKISDPYVSPYGIATVNLPESTVLALNEQFIDENNLPGIGKWLVENRIAEPIGLAAQSGYCNYQAYRFNVPEEALEKIKSARRDIEARSHEPSKGQHK